MLSPRSRVTALIGASAAIAAVALAAPAMADDHGRGRDWVSPQAVEHQTAPAAPSGSGASDHDRTNDSGQSSSGHDNSGHDKDGHGDNGHHNDGWSDDSRNDDANTDGGAQGDEVDDPATADEATPADDNAPRPADSGDPEQAISPVRPTAKPAASADVAPAVPAHSGSDSASPDAGSGAVPSGYDPDERDIDHHKAQAPVAHPSSTTTPAPTQRAGLGKPVPASSLSSDVTYRVSWSMPTTVTSSGTVEAGPGAVAAAAAVPVASSVDGTPSDGAPSVLQWVAASAVVLAAGWFFLVGKRRGEAEEQDA